MSILAIETASQVSSVAVLKAGRLAAEITMQGRLTHSETLMPHVKSVLQMAGTEQRDVSGIAVSIGPGSFTGLRIGLAAAKAMAYAWDVPLVGISTLDVLAMHFPVPGVTVLPIIDAQKGNAYTAPFLFSDGVMQAHAAIAVKPIEQILEEVGQLKEEVILLGDAVRKIKKDAALPAHVHLAPAHMRMPRAACVAMLGAMRLSRGEADNVMNLEPVYIRRSEAEVLWEKRQREAGK